METQGSLGFNKSGSLSQVNNTNPIPPQVEEGTNPSSSQEGNSSQEKLDNLVSKSDCELLRATTIKLFSLTQDQLVIDETKVTVVYKQLLGAKQIHSLPIKDIQQATMEANLLFGTIKIFDSHFQGNAVQDTPFTISGLKKKDAEKAKRIIDGLIVINKQGIDVSKIDKLELATKIEEIGRAGSA